MIPKLKVGVLNFQRCNRFRKYNEKERSVTHMIPEYEVWGTDKILKNVPVKIYFTENGWDKLMRL
jgi:hypothetical protein